MPLEVRMLSDGGKLHIGERGVVQSHWLGNGVLLHTRSGLIDDEFSDLVRTECEQQLLNFGKCVLMVDAILTKMHTTQFREDMTRWFLQNPSAEVHVLTHSSMVRMAVTVAAMDNDRIQARSYEDEALWLDVGKKHLTTFGRIRLQYAAG